MTKILKGYPG